MPSKFDRSTMQLAEKINSATPDQETLNGLADILIETCLKEKGFRCIAGKFCDALATNVTVSFEGGSTFKQQLMEKYQAVHADHDQLLSSHANKCRSLLIFATDLYLQMKENNPSDADSASATVRVRNQALANMLHQLFMSFLTLGKQDDRNLKAVADMLKVSGEALESDEKELGGGSCENMDHLMAAVQSISLEDRVSEETKSLYSRLVEIRQSQWKVDDSEMPNTFVIPEAKPTKKGSNAIAIMAPPGEPSRNNKSAGAVPSSKGPANSSSSHQEVAKNNAINAGSVPGQQPPALSSEDQELTEEELNFMAEQMGDTGSEAGLVGPTGHTGLDDPGLISDAGSDMPDEVEAAFQQFLDEQIQQQQNGGGAN